MIVAVAIAAWIVVILLLVVINHLIRISETLSTLLEHTRYAADEARRTRLALDDSRKG